MRAVDTSAIIEWLADSQVGGRVALLLPRQDRWIVPTMVLLELWKWMLREADSSRADEVAAFLQNCRVVPLDTVIANLAADLCVTTKLATADAVIYATALHLGASLLTCDAHFSRLPDVVFVPKRRS